MQPPSSDNNHAIASPRGVLSRLASEREHRNIQLAPLTFDNSNSSSRIYRPENYQSKAYDASVDSGTTNTNEVPSFGDEYFLNDWTLGRLKSLLETKIPPDNQLCLNVCIDQCETQQLIDEQVNKCPSRRPPVPPSDIRIELIKIYDNVEIVFPSRSIRLYNNDYLLLAILCSYSECAYIRTQSGWAYVDDESDQGNSIIDEISQMIDCINHDILFRSEQCLHVLKNDSFLYYKLVE